MGKKGKIKFGEVFPPVMCLVVSFLFGFILGNFAGSYKDGDLVCYQQYEMANGGTVWIKVK